MINQILFKNYKAFKDGSLKLKPITILLGSNNAGKSSIIQLLLMLSQSYTFRRSNRSSLILNGPMCNLGENKNIFYNKRTNLPIELTFKLDKPNFQSPLSIVEEHLNELQYLLEKSYILLSSNAQDNKIVRTKFPKSSLPLELMSAIDLNNYFLKLKSLKYKVNLLTNNVTPEDLNKIFFGSNPISIYARDLKKSLSISQNKVYIDYLSLRHSYLFFSELDKFSIQDLAISYTYQLNKSKNLIETTGIKITVQEKTIIEYSFTRVKRGKRHLLKSDIYDNTVLNKYASKLGNSIDFNRIGRNDRFHRNQGTNFFTQMIINLLDSTSSVVYENIKSNINHIGPIRSYPKRYYFLDETYNIYFTNRLDTTQLVNLFKDRPDIRKSVNSWLKKFGLNVEVPLFEELISKIKVIHAGLHLDLTDVGFGLSQILPVIAECYLAAPGSITLIEQPEIHLHPKMQAELADLFIETAKNDTESKTFIIETHSEYFLKRLRRRISEGKFSSNDVCVYSISPKNENESYAKIQELKLEEKGSFPWPVDFYADDLTDTFEFLKNQFE